MTSHQPSRGLASEVQDPGKLLRFGTMLVATLEEVRQVSLDETGRRRLQELHRRTVEELGELISEDLRKELEEEVDLPFGEATATEGELRVAHARLVGWLEGLFRGLQASAVSRHMEAQLEALRRRQLEQEHPEPPGRYL